MFNRLQTLTATLVLVSVVALAGTFEAAVAAETISAAQTVPAGVATVDITPEFPVRMYGYGSRKTESERIAGRLRAKALAIGGDNGEGPAVLLTVDCGAVPDDLRDEVYQRIAGKTRLAPERFVLSNSHNHSGPNLKGMASISGEEHDRLARYARQLVDRLEQVVLEALKTRQPCRLAFAQGSVGFAANRRVLKDGKWAGFGAVPDGAVDHSLPVLKVTRDDGTVLAVVANYACHCTTLRGNFKEIHGDWAACAQAFIEADHPGTVAMISIGCGADSDPCPHGTVVLCEQHGRALADEVKRLVLGPWKSVEPRLVARQTIADIAFQDSPDREQLRQNAKRSYSLSALLERLERGEDLPRAKTHGIVTWTFGNDLAMVFLSDEVVVDYALRLKRELDGSRLWVSAYSNSVSRYIVSQRLIGEGGYEVRNSLTSLVTFGRPETLKPAMEDRVVERVKRMLPESFHASKQ